MMMHWQDILKLIKWLSWSPEITISHKCDRRWRNTYNNVSNIKRQNQDNINHMKNYNHSTYQMNCDSQSQWISLSNYQNSRSQSQSLSMMQLWLWWIDSSRKHTLYHFMKRWEWRKLLTYSSDISLWITKYQQK